MPIERCKHKLGLMLLAAGLLCGTALRADAIQPFTSATLAEVKERFTGRPFILSLWSVTCAPCREDLAILAALRQQHPDLPLVLVSTDAIAERESALWVLEDYGLETMESWMFADTYAEPLRFSIDPAWYGELPRSYFFDADHGFRAHSGVLSRELLEPGFSGLPSEGTAAPVPSEAHQH